VRVRSRIGSDRLIAVIALYGIQLMPGETGSSAMLRHTWVVRYVTPEIDFSATI
jgi:hypothetical protein